jgi:hypothetical protein
VKGIKAGFVAVISILLIVGLCACGAQDPTSSSYRVVAPLKEPQYGFSLQLGYDQFKPLNNWGDFIFKGKIDKVSEIEISRQKKLPSGEDHTFYNWVTSCEVTIENVFYGEVPGVKEKIKVVFLQSSRQLLRDSMELKEGQEYYFLTRIITEKEKARTNDVLKIYRFGSVQGANSLCLLPVKDGIVTFRRGWPFTGSKQAQVIIGQENTFEALTDTIDEESFLPQFIALIQAAKGTSTPQATASAVD